jgi:DNA-binding MarR family transcriptional regulator
MKLTKKELKVLWEIVEKGADSPESIRDLGNIEDLDFIKKTIDKLEENKYIQVNSGFDEHYREPFIVIFGVSKKAKNLF